MGHYLDRDGAQMVESEAGHAEQLEGPGTLGGVGQEGYSARAYQEDTQGGWSTHGQFIGSFHNFALGIPA